MATTKLYDLAVKTGEYQDRQGNTKGRYENVGAVMRNDNGQFLMLKRTFNPAGVPGDRDTVLISMFEPSQRKNNGNQRQDNGYGAGGQPSNQGRYDGDSIPFAKEWRG